MTGSSVPTRNEEREANVPEASRSSENLALLYQGLLTGIVRLQSRRQHISDAEAFRRKTKAALQQVEKDAVASGYDAADIRETHYAVVAFLDSVVLNSTDPVRAEWQSKTLQEELFGKSDAGMIFFEKLDHFRSRRDSPLLADILEVYLLCLLLGFEGRYSDRRHGELDGITERVRRRIENIRGSSSELSPSAHIPEVANSLTPPLPASMPFRTIAIATILGAILLFVLLKMNLLWFSEGLRSRLL